MKFSHFAGVALVPLLARLVLFAAFMPQGYQKVFKTEIFAGDQARVLSELGIGQASIVSADGIHGTIRLAAQQNPPTGNLQERPPPEQAGEPAGEPEAAPPTADEPAQAEQPLEEEPPAWDGAPVEARALHGVTAMLVDAGWPREWQPQTMAWIAGLTALLGGAMLLLGLFSRIWGLGLAITMGFAYYLTSWPVPVLETTLMTLADPELRELYTQVYLQLGLLVLALGVCLTGPGPLSVDRLFFGRRAQAATDDYAD